MNKKKKRIICAVLIILVFGYWIYSIGDFGGSSKINVNWASDINQLEKTLTKESPGAFRQVSKKEFHKDLQQLIKETPKLSDSDITIKLIEIVASLKDNNTKAIDTDFKKVYPIRVTKMDSKYMVNDITSEYREILGSELIKINSSPMKDIEEACSRLIPNISKNNKDISWCIGGVDMLGYFKIVTGEQAKFTFKNSKGDIKEVNLMAQKEIEITNMTSSTTVFENEKINNEKIVSPKSVFRRNMDQFWYEYIEQDKTLYCQFNVMSNAAYKIFYEAPDPGAIEIYKKAEETDVDFFVKNKMDELINEGSSKNYDKLIIDLRFVAMPKLSLLRTFIEKIEKLQFKNSKTKLYVITPNYETSYMIPVFQKLKEAGKVTFYGENNLKYIEYSNETSVKLDNSKMIVLYSKEKDMKKLNSQFKPDFLIKVNTGDYVKGLDPIYDAIQGNK